MEEHNMESKLINCETQDIVLAASLKVLGYRLDTIQKVGNKGIFFFSDIPVDILTEYDLGSILVEPVAFNSAIKALTTASRRIL